MEKSLQAVYSDLMGKLLSLPSELDDAQAKLTEAKLTNNKTVKELKAIQDRANIAAADQGSNDAKRKAVAADILAKHSEYQALSKANAREEAEIAQLNDLVEAVQKEYSAICFASTLHASFMGLIARSGNPAEYLVNIPEYSNANRASIAQAENGHVTPDEAKEMGL